jgi:hypothetical protein
MPYRAIKLAVAGIWCLVLLGTRPAQATFTINLRFADGTTSKSVTSANVNQDYTVQEWGTVDGVGGNNGTGSRFGVQFAFYSVGTQKLQTSANNFVSGNILSPTLINPFTGNGAQTGAVQDFNLDGLNDLGSAITQPQNTNYIEARDASPAYDNTPGVTVQSVSGGFEFLLGTFTYHLTSVPTATVASAGTMLSPLIPNANDLGLPAANWFQNGSGTSGAGSGVNNGFTVGNYVAGTGVTFALPFVNNWQNPGNHFDVNADGIVSALDALLVINDINLNGTHPDPTSGSGPNYVDVSGDGTVSALDALQVINYINSHPISGTELTPLSLVTSVPEPATWLLVGFGCVGLFALRPLKRRV